MEVKYRSYVANDMHPEMSSREIKISGLYEECGTREKWCAEGAKVQRPKFECNYYLNGKCL
jgi:hypothetical protein